MLAVLRYNGGETGLHERGGQKPHLVAKMQKGLKLRLLAGWDAGWSDARYRAVRGIEKGSVERMRVNGSAAFARRVDKSVRCENKALVSPAQDSSRVDTCVPRIEVCSKRADQGNLR